MEFYDKKFREVVWFGSGRPASVVPEANEHLTWVGNQGGKVVERQIEITHDGNGKPELEILVVSQVPIEDSEDLDSSKAS